MKGSSKAQVSSHTAACFAVSHSQSLHPQVKRSSLCRELRGVPSISLGFSLKSLLSLLHKFRLSPPGQTPRARDPWSQGSLLQPGVSSSSPPLLSPAGRDGAQRVTPPQTPQAGCHLDIYLFPAVAPIRADHGGNTVSLWRDAGDFDSTELPCVLCRIVLLFCVCDRDY